MGRYLALQQEEASDYLAWLQETPLAALDQGSITAEECAAYSSNAAWPVSAATAQRGIPTSWGSWRLPPSNGELVSHVLELSAAQARQALAELVNYGLLVPQAQPTRSVIPSSIPMHGTCSRSCPDAD